MAVRFVVRSAEGVPLSEELSYGFEQARIVIGRGVSADVRIPHLTVSDVHATVRLEGDGYAITDHDSTNGTKVNGARIAPQRGKRLRDGDTLEIGVYALSFHTDFALTQTVTSERTAELARRLFRSSKAGARLGVPRLVQVSGPDSGKSLSVPAPPSRLLIGSAAQCQLVLADPAVAAEHAEVTRDLDGVLIRAIDPGHALEINGQPLQQRRLRDGDELLLGAVRVLFEEPAEEPIEQLTGEPDRPVPAKVEPVPVNAEPESDAASAVPERESSPPPKPVKPKGRGGPPIDADVLIYVFAAIVIAVSLAGLIALMRGE
jgi:pSer/pThr/pTyr-binding forkhead associated (FHA) protein